MYRIDFNEKPWETSENGVSSKSFVDGARRLRLLEFGPDLRHEDWCRIGHLGYVVEGEFEIEFEDRIVRLRQGDGISIPAGEKDKHRPKAISDKVKLIFFEDI